MVYEYDARDLADSARVPAGVASRLLARLRAHAPASIPTWNLLRYHRHQRFPSSTDGCEDERRRLAGALRADPSPADSLALRAYAEDELKLAAGASVEEILTIVEGSE